MSSRLARAWLRDSNSHSNHLDDDGRPVCVTLDHPRPLAQLCFPNCQMGSHTIDLSMSRFLGGLISLPCRNMPHTFLMLCAEIDGREDTGRRRRHISRYRTFFQLTLLPDDLTAVTSHSWATRIGPQLESGISLSHTHPFDSLQSLPRACLSTPTSSAQHKPTCVNLQLAAHLAVQCIHAFVCITKPVWVDQSPMDSVHSGGAQGPISHAKDLPE